MADDYDPNADALASWKVSIAALRKQHTKDTQMDGGAVTIDNAALNGFVLEIEHQFDERKIISEALREIYERAKTAGFVPAFLRMMVKERQMEPDDRKARYRTLDEYRTALGLFADTPLGEAAMAAASDDVAARARAAWHANGAGKPKPFAEQTVHSPRQALPSPGQGSPSDLMARPRGRPRKVLFDAEHPDGAA